MKFAVIPWSDAGLQDKIFITDDSRYCADFRNHPYLEMKQEFEKRGDSFHTIDMYNSLSDIDYFCFFELHWDWLNKIVKAGYAYKMIYCNAEPPVVNMKNSPQGYSFIKRFFPYILTWNDEWVDNETIFKRNIPYYFVNAFGDIEFEKRKLLTSISGNKKSEHPDELYSEREKVISFFEENYPNDFDFYGTGWDSKQHSGYKGRIEKKTEVYHQYKFAVCFENMKNINGYVTEKILDCLVMGIVPIYAGATDIEKYVPEECFIDYYKFDNINDLASFLQNMNREDYNMYLESARKFLKSEMVNEFSGTKYAEYMYAVASQNKKFDVTFINRIYIKLILYKQLFSSKFNSFLKSFL